ncbi:MAG: hypothetical protein ACKOXB_00495 [Flavobacteriales bacterium]
MDEGKEFHLEYYSQKLNYWDYLNALMKALLFGFLAFLLLFMFPTLLPFLLHGKRAARHTSDTELSLIQFAYQKHTDLWEENAFIFAGIIVFIAVLIFLTKRYYSNIIVLDKKVIVEYFTLFSGKTSLEFERSHCSVLLNKHILNPTVETELILLDQSRKVKIRFTKNPWTENRFKKSCIEIECLLTSK